MQRCAERGTSQSQAGGRGGVRGHVGTLAPGDREGKDGSRAVWEEAGARDPAAPGLATARAPALSAPLLPSPQDLTPPPAHRDSGLRPPRAPSAAPLRRRCGRRRRRRHLPPAAVTQRRRCTSRAAGKWSPAPRPVPAPKACRVGSRPPSLGVHRGDSHFRPSSAMPSGKCSPRCAGAGREWKRRLLGNGVPCGPESLSLDGWLTLAWRVL